MQTAKPNKNHQKLSALVGDWSGDETMHPSPWDPAGGAAKGSYKVREALGGFGVVQDYKQKRKGHPDYIGHGVMGYDSEAKTFIWHWSDSMGGVAPTVIKGEWKGNKLTFQHAGPMGHVRYVYTFFKDGTVGFSMSGSQDGEAWNTFMEGRYTNKKPAKVDTSAP